MQIPSPANGYFKATIAEAPKGSKERRAGAKENARLDSALRTAEPATENKSCTNGRIGAMVSR
jgi:hypothetical protein